ncbi:hypothetical protein C8J56DRAFT_916581 [Mycena floridula]|nr:hypothetical protein C8J56DRAFT_916581 [Mycena floridula]
MPRQTMDKIVTAGTEASKILRDIADITGASYLRSIAAVGLSIFEAADIVKANKEKCSIMAERVYELICAIINSADSESDMSSTLIRSISMLTMTLQKVLTFMRNQLGGNIVKRITRHLENASLLDECMSSLQHALTLFRVQTDILTAVKMREMQETASRRHQELMVFVAGMDSQSLGRFSSSSLSILLPASPKIFHGREPQIAQILPQILSNSPAHIAILGPGGIGKSSLALSILYHPDIIDKYKDHRYWIACGSCNSVTDLMAVVAAHFSVEEHGDPNNAILKRLIGNRVLLVLDNLDTPWEPLETRSKVEGFLSRLTDLDHLSLIITMRGSERPSQVKWTRPFLKPLEPLSSIAARQTFLDISDVYEQDPHIDELLSLSDNLPLAVTLMAGVAEFDGCESVLMRWKERNTALLSDGLDKRSNLEISIDISLQSPRVTTTARELLSVLSYLPDGVTPTELGEISLPLLKVAECRATLCRTSLAYVNHEQRLKLLAPIREYVQKAFPPSPACINALRKHVFDLASLADDVERIPGLARKLIANMGNIGLSIRMAIQANDLGVKEAVMAALKLNRMYRVRLAEFGSFEMLRSVAGAVDSLNDPQIRGQYLLALSSDPSNATPVETLRLQAIESFKQAHDILGQADAYQWLSLHYLRTGDSDEALRSARLSYGLAERSDNPNAKSWALFRMSSSLLDLGNYPATLYFAQQSQKQFHLAGNIFMESRTLCRQSTALLKLGNLSQAINMTKEAHSLLESLAIDSQSTAYYDVLSNRGQIHQFKSEYVESIAAFSEAADINWAGRILSDLSILLVELALTPCSLPAIRQRMELLGRDIPLQRRRITKEILNLAWGNYYKHLGEFDQAKQHCLKSINAFSETDTVMMCFQTLADVGLAEGDFGFALRYSMLYFALAQRSNDRPARLHALRRLGDVVGHDEETSMSLFELCLEGFTKMDIHCGRAECLFRLGDIWSRKGETEKARESWMTARPLFERSSQGCGVERCVQRLLGQN